MCLSNFHNAIKSYKVIRYRLSVFFARLIYVAYSGAPPQIKRFSLDGSIDDTIIAANDSIERVGGMYLNEKGKFVLSILNFKQFQFSSIIYLD